MDHHHHHHHQQQQHHHQVVGQSDANAALLNLGQVSGAHSRAVPLHHSQLQIIQQFWQNQLNAIEHGDHDFKNHQLPLARIKKVMKADEDMKVVRCVGLLRQLYTVYSVDDQCRGSCSICQGLRDICIGTDAACLDTYGGE
jgi:hypothetical protein